MGELIFIGLGLYDERGLSLRGQAEARSCDRVFVELYTSIMPGLKLENLTRAIAKPIEVLSRSDIEEHAKDKIISKASLERVALLVPGDPMIATTHVDLRLRAEKAGIRTRIIHGPSVACAAASVTGLQSYKFGRTVTIPVSRGKELPESVYTGLTANIQTGLHSLILLEADVESHERVTISQALGQLLEFSDQHKDRLIGPETLVVGLAKVEAPDMIIRAAAASDLMHVNFGQPPYCIIVPGRLHFVEAEALQVLCGAPRELVGSKS